MDKKSGNVNKKEAAGKPEPVRKADLTGKAETVKKSEDQGKKEELNKAAEAEKSESVKKPEADKKKDQAGAKKASGKKMSEIEKKKNDYSSYVGLLAFLFCFLCVLSAVLKVADAEPSYWTSMVFVLITMVGMLFCGRAAFTEEKKNRVIGSIPLGTVCYITLTVLVLCATVTIILPLKYLTPSVGILICSFILILTAIAVLKAPDPVAAEEEERKKAAEQTFLGKMRRNTGLLAETVTKAELKREVLTFKSLLDMQPEYDEEKLADVHKKMFIIYSDLMEATTAEDDKAANKCVRRMAKVLKDRQMIIDGFGGTTNT